MKRIGSFALIFILTILCSACFDDPSQDVQSSAVLEPWDGTPVPVIEVPAYDPDWDQGVVLTEGRIQWLTYTYKLDGNNSVLISSFDGKTIVSRTMKTYVLENEYLKITLVPEFGGRILSLIYKPTGHEELWQNPVGAPYLVGGDIFYHDWLMIYGGIFPTYPEPEHGKTWLLPWDVEILHNDGQAVEIQMTFTDTIDNPNAPANYPTADTGIICRYSVRLEDGRSALDTHVELENPGDQPILYEYWTNTGLAPGSEPGISMADENAEIIVPIEKVRVPPWYLTLAEDEISTSEERVFLLDQLRWFKNWRQEGILYAYPDVGEGNFWGVINHGNEEGIFRIADNSKTPGLKFWSFGYDSIYVDPFAGASASRPFIELWAGVTPEFFWKTELGGGEVYAFNEVYSPSVGLSNVTQASTSMLLQHGRDNDGQFFLNLFSMQPEDRMTIAVQQDGIIILKKTFHADPMGATLFTLEGVTGNDLIVTIRDDMGNDLFAGIINPNPEP